MPAAGAVAPDAGVVTPVLLFWPRAPPNYVFRTIAEDLFPPRPLPRSGGPTLRRLLVGIPARFPFAWHWPPDRTGAIMNRIAFFFLFLAIVIAGCAFKPPSSDISVPTVRTNFTSTEHLQAGAQAVVDAFAAEVESVRGGKLAAPPLVEVRNTPMLIFYSGKSNTITVPWWETQPAGMRAVFREFSGGTDAEAERFFGAFFNGFLVAHEAAHWFQSRADRMEPTLYANENQANRIAVAFWRTQPGGTQFLERLEKLANRAAENLPDPTPPGEDPVTYFGSNYQSLGKDPLKYGYYQFRFMADALRDRSQLDFAEMVGAQE